MKRICLIIIASIFYITAIAKTKKADRLFDQWDYFRAAKLYKKEAAKHPGADIYFKLGECYRKMNLYAEELVAYDKVNAAGIYSDLLFYLNYGQVLKTNGRNSEAKIAFDKYSELAPSDPRGKFFSKSIDIVAEDHQWDELVEVKNVSALNTRNAEICPVLYKDGIVFTSNRESPGRNKIYGWTGANYLDLYYAQKGAGDLDFSSVAPFGNNKIIKKFNNGPACFSKDFDTIYISRAEKDLKGLEKKTSGIERNKIFSLVMQDGKWTNTFPFYLNNNAYSVANPFLSADGSRIYFVSDMPGGYGETDIYYCNREGSGWSQPVNMGPDVNTFNREKYPALDAKGNFYFSSDGYQGFGGLDICVALNNNGVLAKAIPLKYPINSSANDFGIVFLKDGKTGYITSNRLEGGKGDEDIYYFDLSGENVAKDLVTSVYTIGYRPVPQEVLAVTPNIVPEPPLLVEAVQPKDIYIYFDFDKSGIRDDAIVHLDSVITYMNEFKDQVLQIGGHCDSRGTTALNLNLSLRRSNAAINYLHNKGISLSRMIGTGYGLTQLVNKCAKGVACTEPEHQLNRSVYFHFKGKEIIVGK